jgi:hypothetical protein
MPGIFFFMNESRHERILAQNSFFSVFIGMFEIGEESMGPQGPPGEVTQNDLTNAIKGTSNNSNSVATLDTPFADPDSEALRVMFNELVLRR